MRSRLDLQDTREMWESRDSERLSFAEAAHLYRRAAMGGNLEEVTAATQRTVGEVVDQLLAKPIEPDPLETNFQQMKTVVTSGNVVTQLPAWWLYRMIHTQRPAAEQLTLFWHGHFATSAAKVPSAALMLRQNEMLRRHSLGKFGDLVLQISRDPAMLIYLDSTTNRRNRPNENYARELLELFCLGLGNYTEQDIKQLARAFTGWELRGEAFQYNRFQHDPEEKQILGTGGIESGEQAIEVVVSHPAAARFIALKWLKFYVSDTEDWNEELVEPFAAGLRQTGFDLRAGLRHLLTSRLFYSEVALAKKIRGPVELAVGLLRTLQGSTNTFALAEATRELGQAVFFPPNVKGWDGGRQWINSASLIGRINLVSKLLGPATSFAAGPVERIDESFGVTSYEEALDRAESLLLARPLSAEKRLALTQTLAKGTGNERSKLLGAIKVLSTMAEFQLS